MSLLQNTTELNATNNETKRGKHFVGFKHPILGDIGFAVVDKNEKLVEILLKLDEDKREQAINKIMSQCAFRFAIAGESKASKINADQFISDLGLE